MECRHCDFWDYGESGTTGAGKCDSSGSSNYGFWTCPDDGCVDDDGNTGYFPVTDNLTTAGLTMLLYLYAD